MLTRGVLLGTAFMFGGMVAGVLLLFGRQPQNRAPCWHVSLRQSSEYQTEIRAWDAATALDSARQEWAHDPTDAYYENDVQPAESVAVRFGADPKKVCR